MLLFIAVPLVELALLFQMARWTSPLFTFGLVIATGAIGATLARWQGFHTLRRIQQELSSGRMPSHALSDGLMILVAGALLLTPGVLTDLFGFSLLVPACRDVYRGWLGRYFRHHFDIRYQAFSPGGTPADPSVVDGTATRADQSNDKA